MPICVNGNETNNTCDEHGNTSNASTVQTLHLNYIKISALLLDNIYSFAYFRIVDALNRLIRTATSQCKCKIRICTDLEISLSLI